MVADVAYTAQGSGQDSERPNHCQTIAPTRCSGLLLLPQAVSPVLPTGRRAKAEGADIGCPNNRCLPFGLHCALSERGRSRAERPGHSRDRDSSA